MALPTWNAAAFGCLIRDATELRSLLRTQLSGSLPAPFVSRAADSSAPVSLSFGLEMSDAAFKAWQQWFEFDLIDGSLPFTMDIPWGPIVQSVRVRLFEWNARRITTARWGVSGAMEIERASLPRWSGGAV